VEEKMDLRIRKTYLALHNAFMELLTEKRFEELTVNELCDRAMIRRTTFYKHFADKYEYFTFYIKEVVEAFQDRLAPEIAENEVDAYLLHMCRESLRFVRENAQFIQNIKESSMFPMLLSILLEQISFDITQVLRRAKQDSMSQTQIEGTAAFCAGGLTNTIFHFLKQDEPIEEESFIELVSKLLEVKE